MSPLKAIRAFCLQCEGGSYAGVADCLDPDCPVREYRFGKPPASGKSRPLATVKKYCLDYCQGGSSRDEVVNCQGDKPLLKSFEPCPFFPFRLGRNPNVKSTTRAKLRAAACKRLASGTHSFAKTPAQTRSGPVSFDGSAQG